MRLIDGAVKIMEMLEAVLKSGSRTARDEMAVYCMQIARNPNGHLWESIAAAGFALAAIQYENATRSAEPLALDAVQEKQP